MDELKQRAGERIEAFHVAAKTAADNGKTKVTDVFQQTLDAIRRIKESFYEIWENEMIVESRERVVIWSREAVQRIREGALPLSPIHLYHELVALFKDRVWRRSCLIFLVGAVVGGSAGFLAGVRIAARAPSGPHARALLELNDQTVTLVEDAIAQSAGTGEVLIRVQAFSVCCADRGALRGRGHVLRALIGRPHLSVGRGFAGVVLDVGHDVTDLEMGDEVWGCVSEWNGGAATELLTIRSTRVGKRPRGMAADTAASLPWAGTIALSALEKLGLSAENAKGKRVAICGAASGEGVLLIQLLSSWGAHITVLAPRHAALSLQDLGAQEFMDMDCNNASVPCSSWSTVEKQAARSGPWSAVVVCSGSAAPPTRGYNRGALLQATAPRKAIQDLRPASLISDRLPAPLSAIFIVTFYTFRILRTTMKIIHMNKLLELVSSYLYWIACYGMHTDWLEDKYRLTYGLDKLREMVENGDITPVLDKVYLPQDFETALAHACSEDAIGTTVIRFP